MVLAGDEFREEYAVEKKSIGPKCKLLVQKQWNTSVWTEIDSTEMFLRSVKEQMATKSRVKNGILQMRLSFRRAKAGQEFQMEWDMPNYVCKYFGEGIHFS